ncbi:hypothetical protein C4D60_Mb11t11260 [Musa balbisiana]|uniref:Major facilitator superfamily (MFS) profile domain-containing protein n=1 Tax=Musa balbisiana TaxID=52838 RepID=A0A4S8J3G7_MUSBA|nr:hypothetical protein C4D60_Mb11t11260 [Musa balbisiana]
MCMQVVLGTLIALKFGTSGVAAELTKSYASILVFFISLYVAAFAWSWSPLGWPVPTEIFPLEIRSAAQSMTVPVNMLFTFLIAHVFLTALCSLKLGLFFFLAGWVVVMTAFIALFLPDTKNVPIEEMRYCCGGATDSGASSLATTTSTSATWKRPRKPQPCETKGTGVEC